MSSRVFRSGDPLEAVPIAWRRAGAPAPLKTPDLRGAAAPPTHDPSAEIERQVQAKLAAAREHGRLEADHAARQQAAERLQPVLAAFEALIQDLSGQGRRLRTEAERDTVKLAVAIARRILHREIAVDPEAVLGLVKAAFAKVEARETHRLRVSSAGAALLGQHRAQLNFPPSLEIAADGSLPQGGAIFETSRGDLDASIDTQLGEIERGLADMVQRRLR